jgi:putative FmdB family regulatory protein
MPTYEYECLDCGARFERLVPSSQRDRDARCPAEGCGSRRATRLPPSGVGLAFGGSGTYDSDRAASSRPSEPRAAPRVTDGGEW